MMDEKLDRLLFEYNVKFNEGFPAYQLFRGRTDEECVEIIQNCLDAGKTAYDLGLVTDEDGIQY